MAHACDVIRGSLCRIHKQFRDSLIPVVSSRSARTTQTLSHFQVLGMAQSVFPFPQASSSLGGLKEKHTHSEGHICKHSSHPPWTGGSKFKTSLDYIMRPCLKTCPLAEGKVTSPLKSLRKKPFPSIPPRREEKAEETAYRERQPDCRTGKSPVQATEKPVVSALGLLSAMPKCISNPKALQPASTLTSSFVMSRNPEQPRNGIPF